MGVNPSDWKVGKGRFGRARSPFVNSRNDRAGAVQEFTRTQHSRSLPLSTLAVRPA